MSAHNATGLVLPLMTITGPAAAGSLIPIALYGSEAISQCFQFNIDVLSDQANLSMATMLHQQVCLTVQSEAGQKRFMHGLVHRMTAADTLVSGKWRYILEVVPRLAFLDFTQDCRVWQHKSGQEILGDLFKDAGILDVSFKLKTPAPKRDYTVQMNETDLAFASRLMREEGWFYFFTFEATKHTLVITDDNSNFSAIVAPDVELNSTLSGLAYLDRWQPVKTTVVGQSVMKDFDPATPNAPLEATKNTILPVANAPKRDVFKWPARTFDAAQVDRRTRFQIEAAEARASLVEGLGRHFGFTPGGKFVLARDPQSGALKQPYVVYRTIHQASQPAIRSGGQTPSYANSFIAFPAGQSWRDADDADRPIMSGLYSAIVIGPSGDEIHTDELGRIKVRFPWDRRKDSTADGSVWVRVVQPWAGPGWGAQFLPRVGTEVAIAFMDGDIDRPVAIGGLFNGNAKPIFTLPAEKTKSGLRTRSTLKGTATNFSEFSFDDAKGKELVFLQAERDHHVKVKRNETIDVGANQTITVGAVQKVTIGSGQHTTIAYDAKAAESGDTYTLRVANGDAVTTVDQGNYAVVVEQSITIDAGQDIQITSDKGSIDIKAQVGISLTVGQNSIQITQQGITISALQLSAKGTTTAEFGSPMTKLSGDGTLTLTGGMIKLN